MEKEYNALTRKLLAEGYTAGNHPDYVRINGYHQCNRQDPLDNFDGGFVYERWWIFERTFKTPCGLQCKGLSCYSGMGYMGIDWTYENDMATTACPYDRKGCSLKHEYLQGLGVLRFRCNVHMVDEEYQYDGSCEGIRKLYDDEVRREKASFAMRHNGRVCGNHMHYDRDAKEWKMHYDPSICAHERCSGSRADPQSAGICPILGRELDKKKGNVYYDIKEAKKKRRQKAQERKVRRLEEKIIQAGYQNLEPYSADRRNADKWLGAARIAELEAARRQRLKEEQEKPVQLSLFDSVVSETQ